MEALGYVGAAVLAILGAAVALIIGLSLYSWIAAPFDAKRLFARVETHFAGLVTRGGMHCVERQYYWKAFGNVTVRYEKDALFVHIYRDRLDWGFMLGCRGIRTVEYEARALLPFLGLCKSAELETRDQYTPEHVGDLVSEHAPQILEYLSASASGEDPKKRFVV